MAVISVIPGRYARASIRARMRRSGARLAPPRLNLPLYVKKKNNSRSLIPPRIKSSKRIKNVLSIVLVDDSAHSSYWNKTMRRIKLVIEFLKLELDK